MRPALHYLCVVSFFSIIISCSNQTSTADEKPKKKADSSISTLSVRKGTDVEPLLNKTDSLQLLYFDDPYGDSVRYTRFFSYTSASDTGTVNIIIKDFDALYHETNEAKKQCRSEGKIIVFAGAEPVKTIYFSTGAIDQCKAYLYFIKDGLFYYFNMSDGTKQVLQELKKKSKRP